MWPSIWNAVDKEDLTLLSDDKINSLQEKLLLNVDYEIISVNKRKLPQQNYCHEFLYVSDIVFKYERKTYILYANIVCSPYYAMKCPSFLD
jgi:hypothetical protein